MRRLRLFLPTVVATVTVAACDGNRVSAPTFLPFLDEIYPVVVERGVVFGTGEVRRPTVGIKDLLLDLYRPSSSAPGPRPAIVLIHGGGFTGGARNSAFATALGGAYAARGYVAVSIDYRLTGDDPPTEALATDPTDPVKVAAAAARVDAALAVAWLRDNAAIYGVHPDRIAVAGYSAGGVTALGVAYWEPGVQRAEVAAVFSLSGGLYGSEGVIDGGEPPLVMVHGAQDRARPEHEAVAGRASLVGLTYEMYEIPGVDHDTPPALDTPLDGVPVGRRVARFLYDRMDLAALPVSP